MAFCSSSLPAIENLYQSLFEVENLSDKGIFHVQLAEKNAIIYGTFSLWMIWNSLC